MKECHLVPTNGVDMIESDRLISETWFLILKKIGYVLYVYSTVHSPSVYTIYNHHNNTKLMSLEV